MAGYFGRAKEIVDGRREAAEREAERRRAELEAVSPELKAVNEQIASAGLKAVRAATFGDDPEKAVRDLAEQNLKDQQRRKEILAELNLPEDYLEVHYTCEKCEDTGTVDGHYCDCFKALVKKLQSEDLSKCAPAAESTFENFDLSYYDTAINPDLGRSPRDVMREIYEYCKAYAEDFGTDSPSILMMGRTGLGKTHLSLAIANVAIEKGYHVVYGPAYQLLGQIEKEHFGKLRDDSSPEETVLTCDLLILDDLGTEFPNAFNKAEINSIVNTRLLSGLPTIINTNLMYDELAVQYSERVYSRLIGNYTPLEFVGRDVRQLKS